MGISASHTQASYPILGRHFRRWIGIIGLMNALSVCMSGETQAQVNPQVTCAEIGTETRAIAMNRVCHPDSTLSVETSTESSPSPSSPLFPEAIAVSQLEAPVMAVGDDVPARGRSPTGCTCLLTQDITDLASDGVNNPILVHQLRDIAPTDWAYQALVTLIERYHLSLVAEDGLFQGDRPLNRAEFAVILQSALTTLEQRQRNGEAIAPEDWQRLTQLQTDFQAELADISTHLTSLEARLRQQEAQTFSTTSTLRGVAIFSMAGVLDEADNIDSQTTLGYRLRLDFDTSFGGNDRLRVRIQARDIRDFASDPIGISYAGTNIEEEYPDLEPLRLADLYYNFPVTDRIQVLLAANNISGDDFVASTVSPLDSNTNGSLSEFGTPPQYQIAAPGSAGVGAIIQLSENLSLDLSYSARRPTEPTAGAGLFNGNQSIVGQLTYLSDRLEAALTYIHAYNNNGFLNDAPEIANTYGLQVNYLLTNRVEIGGGIAYVPITTLDQESNEVWSYQATLALRDIGGDGNLLGILLGAPPYSRDAGDRIPFLLEGFYVCQINDSVSITPGIYWVNTPDGSTGDNVVVGVIRTVFRL
jgi:hypothetical protein